MPDNWLQRSFDPEAFHHWQQEEGQSKHRRDQGLAHMFGYDDKQQVVEPKATNLLVDGTILSRNSDCDQTLRVGEYHTVQRDTKHIKLRHNLDTDRLVEVRLANKLLNPKFWSYNPSINELMIELTTVFPQGLLGGARLEVDFCEATPF